MITTAEMILDEFLHAVYRHHVPAIDTILRNEISIGRFVLWLQREREREREGEREREKRASRSSRLVQTY